MALQAVRATLNEASGNPLNFRRQRVLVLDLAPVVAMLTSKGDVRRGQAGFDMGTQQVHTRRGRTVEGTLFAWRTTAATLIE